MKKILIMGLPNSGKTTLALALSEKLEDLNKSVTWLNADNIREEYNDWDFSDAGRLRQASRMHRLAKEADTDYVISDFVCPTPLLRAIFDADFLIYMDTILEKESPYEDTVNIFTAPNVVDFKITEKNAEHNSETVINLLREKYGSI